MVSIPNEGGVTDDTNLACDWIEVSCWNYGEAVSKDKVKDMLIEGLVVGDESAAELSVSNFWMELQRRERVYSTAYPFILESEKIELNTDCTNCNSYVFFLILSLARHKSKKWHDGNVSYQEQGSLFEHIVRHALSATFKGWDTWISGWGADNPARWSQIVDQVCQKIGAQKSEDYDLWDTPNSKERGMDILLYKRFEDSRPGMPCYLIQCASGKHWPNKLAEPELEIWKSSIDFFCEPNKSFCCPYMMSDNEFKRTAIRLKPGFMIDRERLMISLKNQRTRLAEDIENRIENWIFEKLELIV